MYKREVLLGGMFSLFMLNFVSAYSYYGRFSLGGFLDSLDSSTVILGVFFILFFLFTNFALMKFFKNNALAGVGAFCVSFLMVYGINKNGYDFENLFYSLGLSSDALFTLMLTVLFVGTIFLGFKMGFGIALMVLGLLFIVAAILGLVYEQGASIFMGIIFIAIGYFVYEKFPRRHPREFEHRYR